MQAKRTEWDVDPFLSGGMENNIGSPVVQHLEEQPGFGVELRWNQPRKPWKPFLVITLWRWSINIGWLLG